MKKFSSVITAENTRGKIAVIPDIKCTSPKEGDLLQGRDPVDVAKQLAQLGAPCLSVVTEQTNFGASPALLRDIAATVDIPILRKDFITTPDGVKESLEQGAAAVLLICAIMDETTLNTLVEYSLSIGIEPFVEVCSIEEMGWANRLHQYIDAGANLIGINNRDIVTLEHDDGGPARTASLAASAPDNAVLVSESGILSPEDAKLAATASAHAVLVGTALWQADDMAAMYESLRIPL